MGQFHKNLISLVLVLFLDTTNSHVLRSDQSAAKEICPLPFKEISTARWCNLKTRAGPRLIATYGSRKKLTPSSSLLATYRFLEDGVSQAVCQQHVWEGHRSAQDLGLPSNLRNADGGPPIVLDVGGNIGVTMMLFANSGYRVTVVEPMTQNRKLMNTTLCANPELKSLVTIEAAIVGTPAQAGNLCKVCIDFGGDATVLCPGDDRGRDCDSWEPEKHKQMKEQVKVKTLDQIVMERGLPTVDVVKMDIEGYECQAVKGAENLLHNVRPRYIMSELQNNRPRGALTGCTPAEFISVFRKAHYRVFTDRFNGSPLIGDPDIPEYGYPNFYFVLQS